MKKSYNDSYAVGMIGNRFFVTKINKIFVVEIQCQNIGSQTLTIFKKYIYYPTT